MKNLKTETPPRTPKAFTSYKEFWPYYLAEHSRPQTKRWHLIGTFSGIAVGILMYVVNRPLWVPFGVIVAYGINWTSHSVYEGNKPATFKHPLWSFISDFRMIAWMIRGKLKW